MSLQPKKTALVSVLLFATLSACSTKRGPNPIDPYEKYNRKVFAFNEKVDRHFYKPAATLYRKLFPAVLRQGITNAYSNLNELPTVGNSVLQKRFKNAFIASWRFTVNSTLGIGGLIDVATRIGLKKDQTDFGVTLAKWGDKNSPYTVVPFLGPSTIRDSHATWFDGGIFSIYAQAPTLTVGMPIYAGSMLVARENLLDAEAVIKEAAIDPYVLQRDAYLQIRNAKINGAQTNAAKKSTTDSASSAPGLSNSEDPYVEGDDEEECEDTDTAPETAKAEEKKAGEQTATDATTKAATTSDNKSADTAKDAAKDTTKTETSEAKKVDEKAASKTDPKAATTTNAKGKKKKRACKPKTDKAKDAAKNAKATEKTAAPTSSETSKPAVSNDAKPALNSDKSTTKSTPVSSKPATNKPVSEHRKARGKSRYIAEFDELDYSQVATKDLDESGAEQAMGDERRAGG